jgi:hypothetical protein
LRNVSEGSIGAPWACPHGPSYGSQTRGTEESTWIATPPLKSARERVVHLDSNFPLSLFGRGVHGLYSSSLGQLAPFIWIGRGEEAKHQEAVRTPPNPAHRRFHPLPATLDVGTTTTPSSSLCCFPRALQRHHLLLHRVLP